MPASPRATDLDRDLDVLVLGEINPDVIVADRGLAPAFGQVETMVDAIAMTIGSSSAIFACGAARLGLRVAIVGVVGDDPFGRFMVDALADRGVDVTGVLVDPAQSTGASVILSRGDDRAILTVLGTMASLRVEDVPRSLVRRARHLHVGSTFLQHALRPGLADLFAEARAAGATVSFDPNWDPAERWDDGIDALLAGADVVLPNAAEVRAIAAREDAAEAAAELGRRAAANRLAADARPPLTVVVKRGPEGGLAVRGAERVELCAPSVPVADTTGAGDSFDAGFVHGLLGGRSLRHCLALAVACGSISVRAVGGTTGQATLAEAEARADGLRPA